MFKAERLKLESQLEEFFAHDLSILVEEPTTKKKPTGCTCRNCTPPE